MSDQPCPFCGSNAIEVTVIRDGAKAYCRNCHAAGPPKYYAPDGISVMKKAADAWNERVEQAGT